MNQTANKYGTIRTKMSAVMNEGVKMRCGAVKANLSTAVSPLVEPSWLAGKEYTLLSIFWVIVEFDVCGVKNWVRI